jgi:hypothetical protein
VPHGLRGLRSDALRARTVVSVSTSTALRCPCLTPGRRSALRRPVIC